MKRLLLCMCVLWPAWASAQVAPGTFSTVNTTNATAVSICVGCAVGSSTPAANGGVTTATVVLMDATPSITTNKLYNVGGALYFNGLSLATGSTISGTTGTVPKFTGTTSLGNSNATISGNNWTFSSAIVQASSFTAVDGGFNGSGASLTGIPTSAVSSGNFVATVASGTGITSSVTTGNAAATAISLNNTAVTPSTYGSTTAISVVTVDQQGRITGATTATPQLTLTSTYFSSLSGANITGLNAGNLSGTITTATQDVITRLGTITSGVWNAGAVTSTSDITAHGALRNFVNGSGSFAAGPYLLLANAAATDGMALQNNASNGLDFWGYASSVGTLRGTLTTAGLLNIYGFGAHVFTASGTGPNHLDLVNTTSGTANRAYYSATGGTTNTYVTAYSQGYTSGTFDFAASGALSADGVGGLSIAAYNASGAIRFYSAGTTLGGTIAANQLQWQVGSVSAPSYSFAGHTGTGMWFDTVGTNTLHLAANGVDVVAMSSAGGAIAVSFLGSASDSFATSAGIMTFSGVTSAGEIADVVCMTSGGVLIKSASATCVISSEKFKHDIVPFRGDALSVLAHVQPVTYYLNDHEDRGHLMGAIAERVGELDLDASFPRDMSFVNRYEDGPDKGTIFSLQYEALTTLGIRGIQQLDQRTQALEARIKALEATRTQEQR